METRVDGELFFRLSSRKIRVELYNAFLCSLKCYNTSRIYARVAKEWVVWLHKQNIVLDDTTDQKVEAFFTEWGLRSKWSSPSRSTRKTYGAALRSLLIFIVDHYYYDQPETKKRLLKASDACAPRRGSGEVVNLHDERCLSPQNVDKVLGAHTGRNYCLLRFEYESGQRIGNFISVSQRQGSLGILWMNVHWESNQITVLQKGTRKPFNVQVSQGLMDHLKAYKETLIRSGPNDPVWQVKGKPMNYNCAYAIIRRLKKSKNIGNLTWHGFRHTFARAVLKFTKDEKAVQKALAHRSLHSTGAYMSNYWFFTKEMYEEFMKSRIITEAVPQNGKTDFNSPYSAKFLEALDENT